MTTAPLVLALRHADRLCYAMQQSAVPWLHAVTLQNPGPAPLADLTATIELRPGLAAPLQRRVALVPAGGEIVLGELDPVLDVQALANLLERQRAELRATVTAGGVVVGEAHAELEVLAYNEWPGLQPMPALLAAFVAPNHPALAEVLRDVGARVEQATGSSALDGYQGGSAARAAAIVAATHDALRARDVTYVNPPPSFEAHGQKVRTPEQVLGERLGTCLDLTLLFAAVLEHAGLHPVVVLQQGHAFVGCWLVDGSAPEPWFGPAVELRKRVELGALAVVETTLLCGGGQPFAMAKEAARRKLADDAAFVGALDVRAARQAGVRPLPPRTSAFVAAVEPRAAAPTESADAAMAPDATTSAAAAEPETPPPAPPQDRLEHWKGKLLDLTNNNRLLNWVPTKKTVRLCAHDVAAIENRLQQGARLRVHGRPAVGAAGEDPRDLDLAQRRTGVDVKATFLAEELRAGRLRAEHDDVDLAARLVEIFRHARTTVEESGANTLHLAIGFLTWYETPQSPKPRRAPLLLLPLSIERISVQEGFRFVLDDAEPRLNRTLLQLLARDFDVRTGLGDAPPEDEHGVDVAAVLDAFRAAVVGLPRWEVEASACIGFFSFTKYLMWLDLASRDELLQSPVLRHLVENAGAPLPQDVAEVPREGLDAIDPATLLCPKDADSSQLAAVLAGAAGRTFVLEGPPGTGKSQTITNLIAQALANGKRVLFVAEKRAALEVVQKRLAEVGLGAFCLELHSSKSGPKAVLEQLRRALELGARREPAEWKQLAAQLQQERCALNAHSAAMHRVREHGGSVFGAIGQLIALREAPRLPVPGLAEAAPARVAAARAAVAELAAAGEALGVPANEPWWGVRCGDWTPALARDVVGPAQRLHRAAGVLAAAVAPVAARAGLAGAFGAAGPSRKQLAALLELASALLAAGPLVPALLRAPDWRAAEAALGAAVAVGRQRDAAWAPLAARWRRDLLGLDLDRLAAAWRQGAASFVVLRWLRLRGLRAELAAVGSGAGGEPAAVLADLDAALAVRNLERELAANAPAAALLGTAWSGGLADWAAVEAAVALVRRLRELCLQLVPGAVAPDVVVLAAVAGMLDELTAGGAEAGPRLLALRSAHDEFAGALAVVGKMLDLDVDAAFGAPGAHGHLAAVAARTDAWLAAVPRLREHCAWHRAAAAAEAAGAGPLVAAQAHGELAAAALPAAFERTFLEGWLDRVFAAEPALARFRGQEHERLIARFSATDRRALQLAAEVVVARLAAALPQLRDTQVASSELGVLERELKKQRRHKPVRRLFAEVPGLLGRLAPCILMSPLSVAQFLGRGSARFDLVVFDEASQIPMWDAVGAIGRGRSLVVVGDSRQLPPTNFFQRLDQGDEPANDELPEDLESVLDECGAAGLPRLFLDWHYRSRHESLIAFSNRHYYQDRLLVFPAPAPAEAGLGVRTVRVDGVYDRAGSRQNKKEAEALVAEVVARLRDPARQRRSLGIVTFSQPQQVLIEDLLDRARATCPEIEPFFTTVPEPVFVKNLENVQGDERDAILFSICYGPDPAGKVHENYGPLNLQGGERRLNVAVTRARRELVVFTSLGAEHVANRTDALGGKHLRTFLDYAARGPVALLAAATMDPGRGPDSPFEAAVVDALRARGHEVHTQVGCSGYRIDLAIVDPKAKGRYLLGVECDGATYHSAATARDRDRLRAAVLQGLGWRLHRVWSTDWWQDPRSELERIELALAAARVAVDAEAKLQEDAMAKAAAAAAAAAAVTPAAEPEAPAPAAAPAPAPGSPVPAAVPVPAPDPDGPRAYRAVALAAAGTPEAFAAPAATARLADQVAAVLRAEAPVCFDRLARTVADAWGVARLTDRVRDRVRAVLPKSAVVHGDVVWATAADAGAFRGFRVPGDDAAAERAADELPVVELGNAMAWLLRQHQALAADDLAREAARQFGITRLGAVVRATMQKGLDRLVADGRGVRDGDTVRLP